jgi:hypothetical protein
VDRSWTAELRGAGEAIVRTVCGIGLSLFPRRHWPRWALPAEALALVSALLTTAAGILVGLDGFLSYAGRVAAVANRVPASADVPFDPAMAVSMLSIVGFAFATPLGLACSYLTLSGVVRAVATVADAPMGDPLATIVDGFVHARLVRRAGERTVAARNAREGPAAPDVLLPGAEAGIPAAEWVVVASRLKEGWDVGVFVVTTDRWYRLGPRQDRETPEGLRAFYPLEAVASTEVLRRSVYYDHPRLSALQGAGSGGA